MPPLQTGVPFKELVDGYRRDGQQFATNSVTRRYQVPWDRRQEFINDVMGQMVNAGGVALYRPPASDVEFPWLYANTFSELGVGKASCTSNLVNAYPHANIDVTFAPLTGSEQNSNDGIRTYMEVTARAEADVITFNSPLKWHGGGGGGDTGNLATNAGRMVPTNAITVSLFNWYGAPVGSGLWENNVGKVNSSVVRLLWYTFPAESLMFLGVSVRQSFTNLGPSGFNIDLSFKFRNNPHWNQSVNANGDPQDVRTQGGQRPIPTTELSLLLP